MAFIRLPRAWKKIVLDAAPRIMETGGAPTEATPTVLKAKKRELERLNLENEWLQNILLRLSAEERRSAAEPGNSKVPLLRQAKLLNINRSIFYYHRNNRHSESMEPDQQKIAT